MKSEEATTYSLEGACAVLLLAIAYKIHRMRVQTHSKCCGPNPELTIDTSNPGAQP